MIGPGIYILCALTCVVASVLLWRGYWRSRAQAPILEQLCFAIMGVSNGLLVLDSCSCLDIDLLRGAAPSRRARYSS